MHCVYNVLVWFKVLYGNLWKPHKSPTLTLRRKARSESVSNPPKVSQLVSDGAGP